MASGSHIHRPQRAHWWRMDTDRVELKSPSWQKKWLSNWYICEAWGGYRNGWWPGEDRTFLGLNLHFGYKPVTSVYGNFDLYLLGLLHSKCLLCKNWWEPREQCSNGHLANQLYIRIDALSVQCGGGKQWSASGKYNQLWHVCDSMSICTYHIHNYPDIV